MRRLSVAAALSLAATVMQMAAPSPARAGEPLGGSIVYSRDSDLWLTSPDGVEQARVTSDGATASPDGKGSEGYIYPSQSDDGEIIVAVRNQAGSTISKQGYLWVMNRRGDVLAKLNPPQFSWLPHSFCQFAQNPQGIIRAEVSPDGRKIAYEAYTHFATGFCEIDTMSKVHVVNLDGSGHSEIRRESNGVTTRLRDPSWVDSSRLLLNADVTQVGVNYVDLPEPVARPWFSGGGGTRYPDLKADKLATIGSFSFAPTMDLFTANGGPPAPPTRRCQLTGPAGGSGAFFFIPSWSPGADALAWTELAGTTVGDAAGEGVWVSPVGDLATSCPTRAGARLIAPGGWAPFWGPAPVTLPSEDEAEGDYDGNGSTDVAVYRPSTGVWYVQSPFSAVTWGVPGDVPVPGDYDGNGTTEHAVYRPSTGVWYLLGSNPRVLQWGVTGDVPVPGDYDGNGTTDVAVYRPSTGVWYVQSPFSVVTWGVAGDVPVPGDYDGNGSTEHAVYRPSTGVWYLLGTNPRVTHWGVTGDVPVPGDYDADGATDVAVYRPSTGVWYVQSPFSAVTWGVPGDVPVPGDYDGNGSTEQAVYRPSTGVWYLLGTNPRVTHWGVTGDIPLGLPQAVYRRFF